jgi:hypothetical protein
MVKGDFVKRYTVFSCALIAGASCFASDSITTMHYTLADYHPVRYRIHGLSVEPNLNVQIRNTKDTSQSINNGITNNRYDGNINVYGSHFYRNFSVMSDVALSTWGLLQGNVNDNEYSRGSSYYDHFNPEISYSLNNTTRYRRYLPCNFFIEGEVFPSISHSPHIKNETADYSINDIGFDTSGVWMSRYRISKTSNSDNMLTIKSGVHASIGKGWVADVTAAAVALHMIDRIGALSGTRLRMSRVQMDSLALLLDRFRRKRILDSRIEDIQTMDTLCTYLVATKTLPGETARMAMELNDIRVYGFNQPRYSGSEIKLTPKADIYMNRNNRRSTETEADTTVPYDHAMRPRDLSSWPYSSVTIEEEHASIATYVYGLNATASISKLVGRNLEVDGSLEVSGSMVNRSDSTYRTTGKRSFYTRTYPKAQMKATAGCTWYPSLRSTITFTNEYILSGDFKYTSQTFRGDVDQNSMNVWQGRFKAHDFSSSLNVAYFISPHCTYSIWASGFLRRGVIRSLNYSDDYWGNRWTAHAMNFLIGSDFKIALF